MPASENENFWEPAGNTSSEKERRFVLDMGAETDIVGVVLTEKWVSEGATDNFRLTLFTEDEYEKYNRWLRTSSGWSSTGIIPAAGLIDDSSTPGPAEAQNRDNVQIARISGTEIVCTTVKNVLRPPCVTQANTGWGFSGRLGKFKKAKKKHRSCESFWFISPESRYTSTFDKEPPTPPAAVESEGTNSSSTEEDANQPGSAPPEETGPFGGITLKAVESMTTFEMKRLALRANLDASECIGRRDWIDLFTAAFQEHAHADRKNGNAEDDDDPSTTGKLPELPHFHPIRSRYLEFQELTVHSRQNAKGNASGGIHRIQIFRKVATTMQALVIDEEDDDGDVAEDVISSAAVCFRGFVDREELLEMAEDPDEVAFLLAAFLRSFFAAFFFLIGSTHTAGFISPTALFVCTSSCLVVATRFRRRDPGSGSCLRQVPVLQIVCCRPRVRLLWSGLRAVQIFCSSC